METEKKFTDDKSTSKNDSISEDMSRADLDDDPMFTYPEQRSIIHGVDKRLVTTCGLLYCFSIVDRGNLGAASIAGSVSSMPKARQPSLLTCSIEYLLSMTDDLSLDEGFRYARLCGRIRSFSYS